jgi:protein-tyrosine phosphatase
VSDSGFDPPPAIDWIPARDFADGLRGSVGLTVLPGKRGPSVRYPGRIYRGDVDRDLAALRAAGVLRLILLVEDEELARWAHPAMVERAAAVGVEIDRYPMRDGEAPRDVPAMDAILDSIAAGRAAGDVAVACMGGVGRSGTVVACALVAAGWDPDEAIARVRQVRHPTAVETTAQETFVRKFHLDGRRPSAKVAR